MTNKLNKVNRNHNLLKIDYNNYKYDEFSDKCITNI